MSKYNRFLRNFIKLRNRMRLTNKDCSLISNNCVGTMILHDLGLEYKTPTINLWFQPSDYIKFLQNIHHYLNCDLCFIDEPGISYPVASLDDIKIYFQHYQTAELANKKWQERSKRINFDNLFILFSDRDGCSYQNLADFDALPYPNKIVLTNLPYPEFKSAYYLKGWESQSCVGYLFGYQNSYTGKKHYDKFDYVSWLNQGNAHAVFVIYIKIYLWTIIFF